MTRIDALFHCFGADASHAVDTRTAAAMLLASGCRHLVVNTHTVCAAKSGNDLPVGYHTATLGSVTDWLPQRLLEPVLNINRSLTSAEAVSRTRRGHALTGIRIVKLEVLEPTHRLTCNAAVVEAAAELVEDGFEVWPLITPDVVAARELILMGATVLRLMGSSIGSGRGLDPAWRRQTERIRADATIPVMLDGGVGDIEHAREALNLGFDSVLVNSCLFRPGRDPARELRRFASALKAEVQAR